MCGILGFITDSPSKSNFKMFKKILWLSETRGAEATGIAYLQGKKFVIDKKNVSASQFIKDVLPKHEEAIGQTNICIGHTRFPTQGDPKDNHNNHPVESDNWILVHNGSVTQMPRIKEYKYKGLVDSEVLLSYIEVMGLKKGLPHVERGTASIAVLNKNELDTLYIWKESNPIFLAYDEKAKTLFFASQDNFLEAGLANKLVFFTSFQIRKYPENLLTKVTCNPLKIESLGVVEVNKYSYKSDVHEGWGMYGNSYNNVPSSANAQNRGLELLVYDTETKRWTRKKIGAGSVSAPAEDADTTKSKGTVINDCFYKNKEEAGGSSEGCFLGYKTPCPNPLSSCEEYSSVSLHVPSAKITSTGNKYYIGGTSHDYTNWIKLTHPNKGHLSLDGCLVKKWDSARKSHYIMDIDEAIKEGLVDKKAFDKQMEDYMTDDSKSEVSASAYEDGGLLV